MSLETLGMRLPSQFPQSICAVRTYSTLNSLWTLFHLLDFQVKFPLRLPGEISANFLCSKKKRFRSLTPHMKTTVRCNFGHFPWETNPCEHSSMSNRTITEKKITLTRGYYLIPTSPPLAFLNISFYEGKSALSAYLYQKRAKVSNISSH